ncbi:hypothetical protein [Halobacteriovorax sp.]|uniref:hypothetical protein n=1 Tax=Halobacteriovorax sp. TaxID=2020862 RepID=UPI003AF20C9C
MKNLVLITCALFSLTAFGKMQQSSVIIDSFDTEDKAKESCLMAEVEYDELKDIKIDGLAFEFIIAQSKKSWDCRVRATLDSYDQVLAKKTLKQKLTTDYDKSYTECMKMRNRIINTTLGYVFGDVDFYKEGGFLKKKKHVCEFNFIVVE